MGLLCPVGSLEASRSRHIGVAECQCPEPMAGDLAGTDGLQSPAYAGVRFAGELMKLDLLIWDLLMRCPEGPRGDRPVLGSHMGP